MSRQEVSEMYKGWAKGRKEARKRYKDWITDRREEIEISREWRQTRQSEVRKRTAKMLYESKMLIVTVSAV